jgi:hypothetical protein
MNSPSFYSIDAALGSAILVEFLMVFSLGGILLFFTCKCAMHLANERRRISVKNSQLSSVQNSQKKSVSVFLYLSYETKQKRELLNTSFGSSSFKLTFSNHSCTAVYRFFEGYDKLHMLLLKPLLA